MVRRPPHARLQRALAAARLAARRRRWRWRPRPWRRPRCSRRSRAAAFGDDRARWGSIWFGVGHRHAAVHEPAAVRDRRRVRRSPRCSRSSGAATRWRSCSRCSARSAARSPACSSRWPAWPTRSRRAATAPSGCEGLAIAAAAFMPPVFLSWAFPEGGWAPFPTTAYLPIPLFAIACADRAAARAGARCAGARCCTGSGRRSRSPLETPMGGNAVRLGALFGGPVLLCALWGRPWTRKLAGRSRCWPRASRRSRFWQWSPAVRDVIKYIEDPAAKADYFEPLRAVPRTACPTSAASRSRSRAATGRAPRSRWTAARARLAAPARHRPQPDLLQGQPQRGSPTRAGWPTTPCATWRCRAPSPTRARTASGR